MAKALVKLTFRQVLGPDMQDTFAKGILHYSYAEFKLKSQAYNPEGVLTTFSAMKAHDGRANSLHYKVGFRVSGYIEDLKHIIPGLKDTLGQPVAFETYKFELIESDIHNAAAHRVAVHYITGTLTLHEVLGNYLLLAPEASKEDGATPLPETFMLPLQDGLSICRYVSTEKE